MSGRRENQSIARKFAGHDIHRLVRETAHYARVNKTAFEIAAPNNPRSVTVVMDLGFKSNPNMHRGPEVGPFRVRIEAGQMWVAPARIFCEEL
jgi:hypothetical protein